MLELQKRCGLEVVKDVVQDKNLSRIYGFILYTEKGFYIAKGN